MSITCKTRLVIFASWFSVAAVIAFFILFIGSPMAGASLFIITVCFLIGVLAPVIHIACSNWILARGWPHTSLIGPIAVAVFVMTIFLGVSGWFNFT